MFSITTDLFSLSQVQREAFADFILTFPTSQVVDTPSQNEEEEGSTLSSVTFPVIVEDEEPIFDAPLPPGLTAFNPAPLAVGLGKPHPAVSMVDNNAVLAAGSNLDKNGLPWDDRIHAGSKAKTQDGAWRYKRGLDDASKTQVEAQLRELMGLKAPGYVPAPPSGAHLVTLPPPPAAPAAAAVPITTSNPVASSTVAVMPPPHVPAASGNPFVSLVTFAGAKMQEGKLTDAEIKAACESVGVIALPLMTNRHDLCATVESSLRYLVSTR